MLDVCEISSFLCCYEEDLWPLAGRPHRRLGSHLAAVTPSGRWITVWLSLSSSPLSSHSPRLRVSLMSQLRTPVGPRPPLPTPLRPEVVGYPRASLDGQRQWRALRKGGRSDVVTLTSRCAQVNTARPRTSTPPQHTYMQSRLDHSRSERHRSRVRTQVSAAMY